MSMFLRMAMLNPNLTDENLAKLARQEAESTKEIFAAFEKGMESMKTAKDKAWYMQQCMPILLTRF